MKRKPFIILICVCIVLSIIGISLIVYNSTPYLNCKMWLDDPYDYVDGYIYALMNIDSYARGYYGGIALTAVGGIGLVSLIVAKILKKHETTMPDNVINALD